MGAAGQSTSQRFLMLAGLDQEWRTRAACADADPEIFFATGQWGSKVEQARENEAKQICARCTAIWECGLDADAAGDVHAIRGGMTPLERALARRRVRAS